eukprot:CAMPEP_0119051236 /NCGR_PEP_ID=MMETSP1177-20130426/72918_1 /TAXON_ID=2985 /ORGANISM="Ochromonas sp, Strain CCMP1899" /LENGTH=413 /DNA_ID=CAMNT_0007030369 /DNA_START=378 /DNA_END=1619 /DNA_ORIENTATION=-
MRILMNEENTPKELKDNFGKLMIKNLEGETFAANVIQKKKVENKKDTDISDISILASMMRGLCSVLPQDYWNIEWCFQKEVRQFHLEVINDQAMRSPEYSLGVYKRTVVMRERGDFHNESAKIVKVVDHFMDGQYCDETKGSRSTEVHMQCCEGLHIDNINHQEHSSSLAQVKAMSEPDVCTYQLVVCVPLLCPNRQVETDLGSWAEEGLRTYNQTLIQVIDSLSLSCMVRAEEWWVYEICFRSGIRQYHSQDEVTKVDGSDEVKHRQVILNQYSLGTAPTAIYNDIHALEESTLRAGKGGKRSLTSETDTTLADMGLGLPSAVLLRNGVTEVRSLKLQFEEGTPCDIVEGTMRGSTVEIFCGPRDGIIDIIEDRTCHYHIKVHSLLACANPLLAPKNKKAALHVDFTPVLQE